MSFLSELFGPATDDFGVPLHLPSPREGRERAPTASVSAGTLVQNRQPVPKVIEKTEDEAVVEEYAKTAIEVGFSPGALTEARFKIWLKKNGVPFYNYMEVCAFLDSVFPGSPSWKAWHWVPLREADRERKISFRNEIRWFIDNNRVYQKAVPLSVLRTVGRIVEEIPEVCFFVSDAAERGDPFLMVAAVGMTPYVIECWDEPGFTGRAT